MSCELLSRHIKVILLMFVVLRHTLREHSEEDSLTTLYMYHGYEVILDGSYSDDLHPIEQTHL